jgi:MFS-type transporter involved in bile tolerance (Atg22 family)
MLELSIPTIYIIGANIAFLVCIIYNCLAKLYQDKLKIPQIFFITFCWYIAIPIILFVLIFSIIYTLLEEFSNIGRR